MNWENIQKDVTERTLQILEQYDEYLCSNKISGDNERALEVTLLLNCLTGLLVIPMEIQKENGGKRPNLPLCDDDLQSLNSILDKWGIAPGDLEIEFIYNFDEKPKIAQPEEITLRLFAWRLRDSISHAHFWDARTNTPNNEGVAIDARIDINNNNRSKIANLIFMSKDRKRTQELFKAKISVQALRIFTNKFAHAMLEYNAHRNSTSDENRTDSFLGA